MRYHDGALQWAFVEIDMGTLTLNRFRQKMRAFDLYAGALKNKGGDAAEAGFDVYVLALSEGRMQQLRQATEREIGEGRWVDHYFATFDVLEPTQFGECSWLGSDGTWYQLLYEQAYARPEAAAGSPTRPVEKPKSVAGGQ